MRRALVSMVVVLLLASCGGGGGSAATASPGTPLATLGVIARDTSVKASTAGGYRDGEDGEPLASGDTVRTSDTGFAELAYFDGSFTRVDRGAAYTLTELGNAEGARIVDASLASGRSWHRVQRTIGAGDRFEIDTPVATASVRGTAFLIDCTPTDACVFTVVEGTILITPVRGDPITLVAPGEVRIAKDPANTPSRRTVTLEELLADPFTQRNLALDTAKSFPAIRTSTTTSSTTSTSTTAPPTTTATAPAPATTAAPVATTQPPPPPTAPPPTAPPTTASLSLNLAGSWNVGVTSVEITLASGCFAGATATALPAGGYTVVQIRNSVSCNRDFNIATPTTVACTGARCTAPGIVPYRLTRVSPDVVTVTNVTPLECTTPDGSTAQIAADESAFTFRGSHDLCGSFGNLGLVMTYRFTR